MRVCAQKKPCILTKESGKSGKKYTKYSHEIRHFCFDCKRKV